MKKLFLSLVALVMATMSYAQTKLVATLSQGDNVEMFYGAGAFESAYNAAQSGDVITLSGGEFTGFTITKAVTIRGAGIDASIPTRISNNMIINVPKSDTCRFSMEGVRFSKYLYLYGTCIEPYFLKCLFSAVYFYSSGDYNASSIKDAMFVNCKFTSSLSMYGSTTAKFSHCYIHNYSVGRDYSCKAQFLNCVIRGNISAFYRSTLVNSILIDTSELRLPAETVAMNCTAIGNDSPYSNMQGSDISCSTSTYAKVFKSYKGAYSDSQTFELTEEAATELLGTDGTQIGLYGGQYPYNSTPAYPRITKLNVAKQSTADDKLSVDIEVSATE